MAVQVRGHVAVITETESTYVMIKSTLRFDDMEDIPGLLLLLRAVQRSHTYEWETAWERGLVHWLFMAWKSIYLLAIIQFRTT